MDKFQQVKVKIEEMKAKYVLEHEEEEYPLHSKGYGMWWSGFFSCLKEITKPLIEYIRNFHTPHTKIIIDWDDATITEDVAGWNFDKQLSDMIGVK